MKTLNRCFKDHGIDDDEEKKERTAEYATPRLGRDIERLPEFKDSTVSWEEFQVVLLQEYRRDDSDQLLHTVGYLERHIRDFKRLVDEGNVSQARIHEYCRAFNEIGSKCKEKGNITDKALTFKFLYALPQNIKIRAMKFAARGTRFDPDNIKPFREVYASVEASCAVLKDMDSLVEEQGISSLPTAVEALDTHAIGYGIVDNREPALMETGPREVLPFIRARAKGPSKVTKQEIDDITDSLEKMQILQAVTERAIRRTTTAEVNYAGFDEEPGEIADIGYGGFKGRRDFRDDTNCKWCRNVQVDNMRPQAHHIYMNQCHDYKKFIGMGVIHESDDNNYICIGPWDPKKPAIPIQFSNDTPRRNQVIARTINTIYSHIPERRAEARRVEAEQAQVAMQSRNRQQESMVGNIEAFEDATGYGVVDLISETALSEEGSAWIQGMIAREADIEPVEVRKSKRSEQRDTPYDKKTLQERLQSQATYGRPKIL